MLALKVVTSIFGSFTPEETVGFGELSSGRYDKHSIHRPRLRAVFFIDLMLALRNSLLLCPMPKFHAIFPLAHLEPYPLTCAIDALINYPARVQVLTDAFLP